ncbi:hypothetical protein EOD41_12225 [Mucilaginibacter limnophilus]|uniref:Pentapeptide MXKDX repeat protein n=1 Tax=Mucilaginibacter limnophilus TaxID=1932778 RepID=A0A437MSW6_9SPHI|nr:hypothetical protein [Mucilaginibacter limnophilus]RVU00752.1 hypothetical protein EOD41_12225 [Mucilaginibacter limnophilus]
MKKTLIAAALVFATLFSTSAEAAFGDKKDIGSADFRGDKKDIGSADSKGDKKDIGSADAKGDKKDIGSAD